MIKNDHDFSMFLIIKYSQLPLNPSSAGANFIKYDYGLKRKWIDALPSRMN